MKQQVVITRSLLGWINIKDANGNLLLNMACMELDLSRIKEIKNKVKVSV